MELFPSLNSIKESSLPTLQDQIKVPKFTVTEYKISSILEKISNIDNLDVEEIKSIILRQHSMILNYDLFLSSSESRSEMQTLFTNDRFLQIFYNVIGMVELTKHEIICINKLAYDYFITPTKNETTSKLLLQICRVINNILTIKLSTVLGIENANILAMISNSSFKDEKNVHRVNTFLVRCNMDLSIQDMVNIYCILYLDSFSNVFTYTMLESKPSGMTAEQLKRFDNISSAILIILDSMPSGEIKKVLYNYAFTLKLTHQDLVVRFLLKSAISYTRIVNLIDEVEKDPIDVLLIP